MESSESSRLASKSKVGQPGVQCRQSLALNPRKLAAIDIALLGSKFIITEFAGGVFLCAALGAFVLVRGHSFTQLLLGLYLISLGFNYVPMLIYAIAIARTKSALTEMGDELGDKRRAMAEYRRQSLWLLAPLLVPIVALAQRHKSEPRVGAGLTEVQK